MNTTRYLPPRRSARTALAASIVLAGLALAPLASAGPASAAQCQISPGLQEPAAKAGITCGDATDTSSNGQPPGGGPTNYTECEYGNGFGGFPEGFLDFMKDEHTDRFVRTATNEYVIRTYYDKETGRTTGEFEVGSLYSDHSYTEFVTNSTLVIDGHVIHQMAGFDCRRSRDGWSFSVIDEQLQGDGVDSSPAAPELPPHSPDVRNPIGVSGAMTPLPGRPNEYLLRVNLTNTGSTPAPYVDATFDLTQWGRAELVSGPATCDAAAVFQACHLEGVPSGATSILVFHVSSPLTSEATLPVSVTNQGRMKWSWSAIDPRNWESAPVQTTFLVTMPH